MKLLKAAAICSIVANAQEVQSREDNKTSDNLSIAGAIGQGWR